MAAVTYVAKKWGIKVNIMEMKCLRSMCDAIRTDRVSNGEVKCIVGVKESMSERVNKKMLKWFGQV